jgi:hypothetical protein
MSWFCIRLPNITLYDKPYKTTFIFELLVYDYVKAARGLVSCWYLKLYVHWDIWYKFSKTCSPSRTAYAKLSGNYIMFLVSQISKPNIILCSRVRLFKALILWTKYCANKVDVSAIFILLFERSNSQPAIGYTVSLKQSLARHRDSVYMRRG